MLFDSRFRLMPNNPIAGRSETYLRDDGKFEPGTFVGYTRKVVNHRAYERGVHLRFIKPGKLVRNGCVETFHGQLRDGCLIHHWCIGLNDARHTVETWRQNNHRACPHNAIAHRVSGAILTILRRNCLHAAE